MSAGVKRATTAGMAYTHHPVWVPPARPTPAIPEESDRAGEDHTHPEETFTMSESMVTLGEIRRTCDRIEKGMEDLRKSNSEQSREIAQLARQMAVFEATRPSMVRPMALGAGSGGAIFAIVKLVEVLWK